ncbi:structural protein [Vibrio phage CKB-S1]|nr:structural protein [Vibrio phage CKB-S1]
MALSYTTAIRNDMLALVATAVDVGPAASRLRIYGGVRPTIDGAPTTLLAELNMSDPSFDAPANGQMSANAISPETATPNSGTATWFRIVDGNGNTVVDGDVGLPGSGAELELGDVNILQNQEVRISSMTITEGNP